jgi:plastocyanin
VHSSPARPRPSHSKSPQPCAVTGASAALTIQDEPTASPPYNFAPRSITVACGTKVTLTDDSHTASHTWTSTKGLWDYSSLMAGDTRSYTFRFAGSYDFVCTYHSGMQGTITVH